MNAHVAVVVGAGGALGEATALTLAAGGLTVVAVAPQLLDTPANRATFPPETMAQAVAPQAIADVIAFLVSGAAAPVSGAILPAYGA